jgi:hypothetical protein
MVRRLLTIAGVVILLGAAVFAGSLFINRQNARSAAGLPPELSAPDAPALQGGTLQGKYYWSFAAKFVCGVQDPLTKDPASGVIPGEPVFKPGNYATDINIHNYNYRDVIIKKKLVLLVDANVQGAAPLIVREPQVAGPTAYRQVVLVPDGATLDDCNALYMMANNNALPTTQPKIFSGYLVILSPIDLDVDVVYTAAEPGDVTLPATSISEDVTRVTGKRVFIPVGAVP